MAPADLVDLLLNLKALQVVKLRERQASAVSHTAFKGTGPVWGASTASTAGRASGSWLWNSVRYLNSTFPLLEAPAPPLPSCADMGEGPQIQKNVSKPAGVKIQHAETRGCRSHAVDIAEAGAAPRKKKSKQRAHPIGSTVRALEKYNSTAAIPCRQLLPRTVELDSRNNICVLDLVSRAALAKYLRKSPERSRRPLRSRHIGPVYFSSMEMISPRARVGRYIMMQEEDQSSLFSISYSPCCEAHRKGHCRGIDGKATWDLTTDTGTRLK